jgi:mannose-6-phosphate isomerase-like protein (cupin superfamily)
MHGFPVAEAAERLAGTGGGYEVVHEAAGLEVGVYVLVAPAPDTQQPHEDDEVYVVLSGSATLDVAGTPIELQEGQAVFVEAHAPHRFRDYDEVRLLVVFTPPAAEATALHRSYRD